jgi:hypothetical protein
MKVSKIVAEVIKDITDIRTAVYEAAKSEVPLAPVKYLFFLERLACDYETIAKEAYLYDGMVKNNRAAQFVSLKVEADKKGEKFVSGMAEVQADSLIAEERKARDYFEAARDSTEKLMQVLRVHLEIFKNDTRIDANLK